MGRKPRMNKKMIKKAYEFARQGLTNKDIANNLGVSEGYFYEYLKKYPEFYEAIQKGKEEAIALVEDALFKRATGYNIEEEKIYISKTKDGKETVRKEKIKKHVAPDTTAMIFYLKNRAPEKWNDKRQLDITQYEVKPILPDDLLEEGEDE